MRRFNEMPSVAQQIVGYMLPDNGADDGGYSWRLYVQAAAGRRRNPRGFVIDSHGALRKDVSYRTLALLIAEGYVKEHPRREETEWRVRGRELPLDLREVKRLAVTEYVLTMPGRYAAAHPYEQIDPSRREYQ